MQDQFFDLKKRQYNVTVCIIQGLEFGSAYLQMQCPIFGQTQQSWHNTEPLICGGIC